MDVGLRDSYRWQMLEKRFSGDYASHWAHLSRLTNMLIILNISLFFLTELVTRQGYYFTYYSLFFFGLVEALLLLPLGLMKRLWYYLLCLVFEAAGVYFLVTSAWYWVITNTES